MNNTESNNGELYSFENNFSTLKSINVNFKQNFVFNLTIFICNFLFGFYKERVKINDFPISIR